MTVAIAMWVAAEEVKLRRAQSLLFIFLKLVNCGGVVYDF